MKKNAVVLAFTFLACTVSLFGQSCYYSDLSSTYDFEVKRKIIPSQENELDSCWITLKIYQKANKKLVQTISFGSAFMFSNVFTDNKFSSSFSTSKNINNEIVDGDHGDLIVADLNFDGLEDFAIKGDSGGNSGPTYIFYMQTSNGKFKVDKYLTENMEFFPVVINKQSKTLETLIFIDTINDSKMTYKFNSKSQRWKRIKHEILPRNNFEP